MKVFVTGGSGFVGKHLLPQLVNAGHDVTATYFNAVPLSMENINWVKFSMELIEGDISKLLMNNDVVIHLAALAHQQNKTNDSLYFNINSRGTQKIANIAVEAGIKHFIFLSTIKVNGEFNASNEQGVPISFSENDEPKPIGPYAESKCEAEHFIKIACQHSKMSYTIVRPPVIYGPEVKANIYKLIDVVSQGVPLPLSLARKKRSMLYVENLVDLIVTTIKHDRARNKTYLVKDIDVSTSDLIKAIARCLDKKERLVPVPLFLLEAICFICKKISVFQKLTMPLIIDDKTLKKDLNWEPPIRFEKGLKRTVDWYLLK
jgi:nucleoside-diphosphate-sugar epimerase